MGARTPVHFLPLRGAFLGRLNHIISEPSARSTCHLPALWLAGAQAQEVPLMATWQQVASRHFAISAPNSSDFNLLLSLPTKLIKLVLFYINEQQQFCFVCATRERNIDQLATNRFTRLSLSLTLFLLLNLVPAKLAFCEIRKLSKWKPTVARSLMLRSSSLISAAAALAPRFQPTNGRLIDSRRKQKLSPQSPANRDSLRLERSRFSFKN